MNSKNHFCERNKTVWRTIMPPIIFLAFMLWIFLPNELYLTNSVAFYNHYISFLLILLGAFLLTSLILYCISMILHKRILKILGACLSAFALVSYVQTLILNGHLREMNGDKQVWTSSICSTNLIIWGVLMFL